MMTEWIRPAGPREIRHREVHVWKGHVHALAEDHRAMLIGTLDPIEGERASRFHARADRDRFIISHGVLRLLVAAYSGCRLADLAFGVEGDGRPHLIAPATNLSFNLSHSGDVVLVAIGSDVRVGVDVEQVKPRSADELWRVARRVFSAAELAAMERGVDGGHAHFHITWARKEAYIKGTGAGLSGGTAHFSVCREDGTPVANVQDDTRDDSWWLTDLPLLDGHAAALATDRADTDVTCFEMMGGLLPMLLALT